DGAVATLVLRLVKRDVGMTHKLIRRRAVFRGDGEADGRGHADILPLDAKRRFEGLSDAPCQSRGGFVPGRGAQDGKLIAAEAREKIMRSQPANQALGDGCDQLIAGLMAERVVDILEAIDIDISGDGTLARPLRHGAVK